MTNKEAIDTIKHAIAEVEWTYPMDYAVAFDKAIEALELLNEHEAIKPTAFVDKDTGETRYVCSNCGYEVRYEELVASGIVEIKHSYCPSCGKKVKWE